MPGSMFVVFSLRRSLMLLVCSILLCSLVGMHPQETRAQKAAKYGAEFLAGGVGARALGMGGAYVAMASDVNAGYWNAAGLSRMQYPEAAYMHVERFAGAVSFDYGSVAIPVSTRSTVGISLFRSGVNDIKNTLNAWDPERNQPRANPENYFETFSAADYAFFLSYARSLSRDLSLGVSGKIVRRTIGDFADAWGYSFDVSAQYRVGQLLLGANLQDASSMLQSWSVNPAAFNNSISTTNPNTGSPYTFEEMFSTDGLPAQMPQGGTFRVLPVARLGSGYLVPLGASQLALGLDVDLAFDGQQANVLNAGDVSFHPRVGTEYSYKNVVALRAGLGRVLYSDDYGLNVTPTVGAGLRLQQVHVDYGFGDFAGMASDLGFSHRISVQLTLEQPGLQRAQD